MPKFFIDGAAICNGVVEMRGEKAHHIVNVLRHRQGDIVTLCDGRMTDYAARLLRADGRSALFEIAGAARCESEPPLFIRLYQSLIKWERFEGALSMAVEAGAAEIVPIAARRSPVGAREADGRTERLRRIAESAAEQSMRGIVPEVCTPRSLESALADCAEPCIYGCIGGARMAEAARSADIAEGGRVAIWIGPEGGFTDGEEATLKAAGAVPVSLGRSVLRADTAGAAAVVGLVCCFEGRGGAS